MITKVVGVKYKNKEYGVNRQTIIKKMSIKDRVFLRKNTKNRFDSKAIAVYVLQEGKKKQIGYLKAELAGIVSDMWKNYRFIARINEIKAGDDFRKIPWGVSLKITKQRLRKKK